MAVLYYTLGADDGQLEFEGRTSSVPHPLRSLDIMFDVTFTYIKPHHLTSMQNDPKSVSEYLREKKALKLTEQLNQPPQVSRCIHNFHYEENSVKHTQWGYMDQKYATLHHYQKFKILSKKKLSGLNDLFINQMIYRQVNTHSSLSISVHIFCHFIRKKEKTEVC